MPRRSCNRRRLSIDPVLYHLADVRAENRVLAIRRRDHELRTERLPVRLVGHDNGEALELVPRGHLAAVPEERREHGVTLVPAPLLLLGDDDEKRFGALFIVPHADDVAELESHGKRTRLPQALGLRLRAAQLRGEPFERAPARTALARLVLGEAVDVPTGVDDREGAVADVGLETPRLHLRGGERHPNDL